MTDNELIIFNILYYGDGIKIKDVSKLLNEKNSKVLTVAQTLEKNKQTKGDLIPKCPFGITKSTKKTNQIFVRISALASKRRSNQKNKGTLYH